MNNWFFKEKFECTGTVALVNQINSLVSNNRNAVVVSKIKQEEQNTDIRYTIELWYNIDSGCNVINAFTTDYL